MANPEDVAVEAARRAGQILKEGLGRALAIDYKGEINLVTEVDRRSEAEIVSVISEHFPSHRILAEEGTLGGSHGEWRWVIDPLDGTTNYAHGYPVFSISIALQRAGATELGVVYAPIQDELFVARLGDGARLNGKPIRVSRSELLIRSLLSTGFPYDLRNGSNNLDHWSNFVMRTQAVRRDGSAALDLCYVAMGRFDGFWELKLSPWDVAAGALIVQEAKGSVTDFAGGPFAIDDGEIVASNGRIHKEMLGVLSLGRRAR